VLYSPCEDPHTLARARQSRVEGGLHGDDATWRGPKIGGLFGGFVLVSGDSDACHRQHCCSERNDS
jgi:hypothetical protein